MPPFKMSPFRLSEGVQNIILGDPFTDYFVRFGTFGGNSQYDLHTPLGKSMFCTPPSQLGKRGLWKRGLFKKIDFLEILENLGILEILEISRLWKIKENSTIF